MSFGLENKHPAIEKAIRAAEGEGIICTVAASNYGGNAARAFPAKLDQVLCIHAGDGNGNKSGLDPTPRRHKENLSTLGVCIPSEWEDDVYVTGTSYAAPVAAGIAANVLRFVQHATEMNMLTPEERQEAFGLRGMRNIMLAMCEASARDGYNFVAPWRRMWNVGSEMQHVVSKIKEALKDDM
ncbi:hypothetical protein NW767_015524 [Fusarium falciforme]|nr:hypothetical protein NW767_015524 [Fusarium falciforme]